MTFLQSREKRVWDALRQQTTGLPVLSWFTSSSKIEFWLSREKRGWDAPCEQTTGLPVLSGFTSSSREERVSISWERGALSEQTTGLPVLSWFGFGFGWVGWELFACRLFSFWLSSNFWTQFLYPIMFQGNLWRKPKWHFSSFHLDSVRDTIGWACIGKDDGVRSCLIELQSFLLSKIHVDPVNRVMMCFQRFLLVPCKTWCVQVNLIRIVVFLVKRIHSRKEYCLFFFDQNLSSRYQSWIDDGM